MKRYLSFWGNHIQICLILFCSCFLYFPLNAGPLNLFGAEETSFSIAMTNDLFAGELPLNTDDWRSFGLWARIGLPYGLDLSLENYGLTDRAVGLRIDELSMALTFKKKLVSSFGVFSFLPGLGFRIYGSYGGEDIQDFIHFLINVPPAQLAYLEGDKGALEYAEGLVHLGLSYAHPIEIFDSLFLHPFLRTNFELFLPLGLHFQALTGFSVFGSGGEHYELALGWAERHISGKVPELFSILEKEEGFFLAYLLQSGFFRYEVYIFPNMNFANGTIAIVFYEMPSRKRKADYATVPRPSYKESHLITELSIDAVQKIKRVGLFVPLGQEQDIGSFFGKPQQGKTFSFLAGLSYRFGNLMQVSLEGELPRYASWTGEVQCRFGPFISSFPLDIVFGLGLGYWHIYYWQRPVIEKSEQGFLLGSKLGLTTKPFALFPRSPLFAATSRYAVSIDYGPKLFFQESKVFFVHSVNIILSIHTDLRG